MSITTPLHFETSTSSSPEVHALRSEIQIKDQQLKLYELRKSISSMSQSSAKRNLPLEVAKLEIQLLKQKIALLESKIDDKDLEIVQSKLQRDTLLKELNDQTEVRNSTFLKNEMVDDILTVMRRAKDEIQEVQKTLVSVKIQKESTELRMSRDKKNLEFERDVLRRDNEMLIEEMRSVRREADAQTARLRKRLEECTRDFKNLKKEHAWALRNHTFAVQKDQEIIDELENELEEERRKNEQWREEQKENQVPMH